MQLKTLPWGLAILGAGSLLLLAIGVVFADDYEQEPIAYSQTAASDPVARWPERLRAKTLELDTSTEKAFVASVLEALEIPQSSQVLVFSKTSFQNNHISPTRPRAIYFSPDYYVGWVQGGDIEIISMDPELGPIFYRLTTPRFRARDEAWTPELIRSRDCLNCHGSGRTGGTPGMLVRSVKSDISGFPILSAGSHVTRPESPLEERWGGWYVTGRSDGERHQGNLIFAADDTGASPSVDLGGRLRSLAEVVDMRPYLQETSDIVALMTMESQIAVHNQITATRYAARMARHRTLRLAEALGEPEPDGLSETNERLVDAAVDRLLDVMLSRGEFVLEGWGVDGSTSFQQSVQNWAPSTADGRSLVEFDLASRLFKHRLSYMVYSTSFEDLEVETRRKFYARLRQALQGELSRFDYLPIQERSAIWTILRETKPEFLETSAL